jgi:hypothetical protein
LGFRNRGDTRGARKTQEAGEKTPGILNEDSVVEVVEKRAFNVSGIPAESDKSRVSIYGLWKRGMKLTHQVAKVQQVS